MKKGILIALLIWLALMSLTACNKQPASSDASQQQQQLTQPGQQAAGQPPATPGGAGSMPPGGEAPPPAAVTQAEKEPPPPPPPLVVPAGTTLKVRLNTALGSKTSQAGQPFSGSLMTPVSVDGEIVIPAGSAVEGEVVDAKAAGRFKGAATLSLKLTGISAKGRHFHIATETVSQTS
ncbi:MAG TPA: hypothetical protein VK473_13700, partial [Terriglobales bacterium]|nr:hypothetical protein [Terriglobales bacterium]